MNYRQIHMYILVILIVALNSCNSSKKTEEDQAEATKSSDIFLVSDSSLFDLIDPNAELEIVADSFVWSEGPVWVPEINSVLFSDVPANKVYKWNESEGLSVFLNPSGYTGSIPRGGEPGSNGLTLNNEGELILCQHGDRQIAKLASSLEVPKSEFETVTDNWEGKRFNSPNDACVASDGRIYFTDPPYGLVKQMDDSSKEISFQGVYMVRPGEETILLVDSLTRPNGIALTPDESQLMVSNSDPEKARWYIYDVNDDGTLSNGKVFFDATDNAGKYSGLPDGMKIDSQGNVFASGPGGIYVFNREGRHLGIILTGQATANCAFGADENILFITADMYLMRLKMKP